MPIFCLIKGPNENEKISKSFVVHAHWEMGRGFSLVDFGGFAYGKKNSYQFNFSYGIRAIVA